MDTNILADPVIRISTLEGSTDRASLPAVYAALMGDEIDAFPALRPHQRHAWHAFLAQLGAMAMHRAGLNEMPGGAEEWRDILRGLTPDFPDDEPWTLVVEDITKSAFMQPPASSDDRLKDYDKTVLTPDGLDMLVLSKNHDIKSAVAARAEADDWMFALITLQTMEGYTGRGNYGISRMPSGYGNRPAFSITPSDRHGLHIQRDVEGLMEHRSSLLSEYPLSRDGIRLVWTIPWDGTKAETLLLNDLDPFYIEVCRRIRLQSWGGGMQAMRANSASRRIVDVKGLTGDPWAPTSKAPNKQGTPTAFLGPRKFSYTRVVDGLTSPDWEQPYLLRPSQFERESQGKVRLVARGMVRGEGGTEGYHERIIPISAKVKRALMRRESMNELGEIAQSRISNINAVQRILSHAIRVFAAWGDSENSRPEHGILARPWLNRLDEFVDTGFFEDLQVEFESDDREERVRLREAWLLDDERGVVSRARRILREAEEGLPCPAIHRYRARANAENLFEARIRGPLGLPEYFERTEEE